MVETKGNADVSQEMRSGPRVEVSDMILGVYAKKNFQMSGFGGTRQAAEQKTFWFVRRLDDESYEVQPLNSNNLPSGVTSTITKRTLMTEYVPEVDYYERKTQPVLQSLQRKLDRGEELFQADQLDAAEAEFAKVLFLDEQHPQANLRLGDICCQKKDYKQLKKVLRRILNSDRVFAEGERHRFNEFGMNLRKSGLLAEALEYYSKAVAINTTDEHLHFNVARVLWEMQDIPLCQEHLEAALRINPEFDEARRFLAYSQKHHDRGVGGGPVHATPQA
ncbi:tetratricopeptide repeat protein [Desulfonatronum thioautotrophicum]|uniref:tetratricopeptide repeat protein n=1 Tax=Desulfonatronum thioautotrophicum TaxID=617001 RepID=UPI00137913A4|nr:tetratricopeptide repeat protein [Desulfonatronum thioautotrophicum]